MSPSDPPARVAGSRESEYVFANAWERARERLALLESCHDPTTFDRAAALGVGQGWRCLDAGAGHGSVARWLARRVGADGRVVAADVDTGLLHDVREPNVEVRQLDLVADVVPAAEFDFVHTRMVLMHIPTRDEVVAKLVAALRPGGVLMIEEQDLFPVGVTDDRAYVEAWQAFVGAMRAAGVDPQWARRLPGTIRAAGLEHVGAEVDVQFFSGGSPQSRFWSLTWLQARERLLAAGVPAATIDGGRERLTDPEGWFYGPAMVIGWGTRPPR